MTHTQKVSIPYYLAQIPAGAAVTFLLISYKAASDTDPVRALMMILFGALQMFVAGHLTKDDPDATLSNRSPIGTALGTLALVATQNLLIAASAYVGYYLLAAFLAATTSGEKAAGDKPVAKPAGTSITREDADALKEKMVALINQRDTELNELQKSKKPAPVKEEETKAINERIGKLIADL